MWGLGNEWNYNGLYVGKTFEQSVEILKGAAVAIKAVDQQTPVATIYGGTPSQSTLDRLAVIDAWGLNVYSYDSFYGVFDTFQVNSASSPKPMFFGEYGADAYNALNEVNGLDEDSQAVATTRLLNEIGNGF